MPIELIKLKWCDKKWLIKQKILFSSVYREKIKIPGVGSGFEAKPMSLNKKLCIKDVNGKKKVFKN